MVDNLKYESEMDWEENKNCLVGKFKKPKLGKKVNVAAFDLDDTVITPIGKVKHSRGIDDWKFYVDAVPKMLKDYHKQGYQVVIISNQKGISTGKTDKNIWKQKLDIVAKKLDIPLLVVCSKAVTPYRKPMTKMWDDYVDGNKKGSFYCGDAAGLPKRKINNMVIPRDFSDSDLKFALNVGIRFMHRDEFIFRYNHGTFNIKSHPISLVKSGSSNKKFVPNHPELIINVGPPGSGKSFYTKNFVLKEGYEYINQDTLKTFKKCLKACEESLKEGKSVVIDNTNPSKDKRKSYIDIAKKYGFKTRCFLFDAPIDLAKHNNHYRFVKNYGTNTEVKLVPSIAYNMYKKYYQEPTTEEGLKSVETVNFVLNKTSIDSSYLHYYF